MFNLLLFAMLDRIPADDAINKTIEGINDYFSFIFNPIGKYFGMFIDWTANNLSSIPPYLVLIIVAILAFFMTQKKLGLAVFSIIGLWFIYNQGYWLELMETFSLVLISSLLAIILGVPLGILMSKSKMIEAMIQPILNFMETIPAFIYLIPAVAFFGIGVVPGVLAAFFFAILPTISYTNRGIQQVSSDLVEVSEAFGSTHQQKLFKVELPIARPTITAGMNRTVMLSLSIIIIASMINTPGLGEVVFSSIQNSEHGAAFVAGFAIIILAVIMNKLTHRSHQSKHSM